MEIRERIKGMLRATEILSKERKSAIRDMLFNAMLDYKLNYLKDRDTTKAFIIFDRIFKDSEPFKKRYPDIRIIGVGHNRGAFLIDGIVVKVNIVNEDENKAEKKEIEMILRKEYGKYLIIPLLGSDMIWNEVVLFFPKCEDFNEQDLSNEQKMHLEIVRKSFIDTDKREKNVMKLGIGLVCIDVQTGTTLYFDNVENEEAYGRLKNTAYWKEWTKFIYKLYSGNIKL